VPAQPLYRRLGFDPADYPEAQAFYSEALSIPLFYDLRDNQQAQIVAEVKRIVT